MEVTISIHIISTTLVYILRKMTQVSDDIIHHYVIRSMQHLSKRTELCWTDNMCCFDCFKDTTRWILLL